MSCDMQISKSGLDLIKSFEGYIATDRYLINGQNVVGYGHLINNNTKNASSWSATDDAVPVNWGSPTL